MDIVKNKILLSVDGSDESLNAVRYASQTLNPQNTETVLFQVARKIKDSFRDVGANPAFHSRVANISAWETTQGLMIAKFMNQAKEVLVNAGFAEESVLIKIHESEVGIARDIIKEANNGYRAIIAGRRGLGRLTSLIMGSVAAKLVERLANVPLWLVGGTPRTGKLLLGLDASEGALRAVEHVGKLIGQSDFEIALVHVFRAPNVFFTGIGDLSPSDQRAIYEQAEEEITPTFEAAKNRLIEYGFDPQKVSTKLITGVESRAGALIEEAKDGGFETIVVGRRGISKVEEFFMGRVTNKIIQLAQDMAVWLVS